MVFQHVAYEILGTLNPMLKDRGFRIRYVNFERHPDAEPEFKSYNGLIVLGGYMGVHEQNKFPHLKTEMKLIEEALKKGVPILGICLGSQLIAEVLGARVRVHHVPEFGWHEVKFADEARKDPLFCGYNKSERIFQMHQDTFDIPGGAIHLASTDLCDSQAFRYGDNVYGLQFHLEVDEPMVHRWMRVPSNRELILSHGGEKAIDQIIAETQAYIPRSLELSRATFDGFINLFNLPLRPLVLGSGHEKPIRE